MAPQSPHVSASGHFSRVHPGHFWRAPGKKIIHRDLKPANVLLANTEAGRTDLSPTAKVMDFGYAVLKSKVVQEAKSGMFSGTLSHAAPEQLEEEGMARLDHRADLWAIGVILYEMLSGENPFRCREGEGIREHYLRRLKSQDLPDVDGHPVIMECPPLHDLLRRLLTKDPRARISSAKEVAAVLKRTPG